MVNDCGLFSRHNSSHEKGPTKKTLSRTFSKQFYGYYVNLTNHNTTPAVSHLHEAKQPILRAKPVSAAGLGKLGRSWE